MEIENTDALRNWIQNENLTEESERDMCKFINAFSEYLVSANPDFLYNKTYLPSFLADFFKCQTMLRRKYFILKDVIVDKLLSANLDMRYITICIDGMWEYKNENYKLLNSIHVLEVEKDKIKLELKYGKEQEFVVADEVELKTGYDVYINNNIQKFIKRIEEFTNDEKVS